MINVKYDRDNLVLQMNGHAYGGAPGTDIICSAASILVYTLAQNIQIMEHSKVAKDVHVILEDGNALVSCRPVEDKETLQCIFDSVTTGFWLLHQNYPDNVQFFQK